MSEPNPGPQPAEPRSGRPEMPAGYGVSREAGEGLLPWQYLSERMAGSRNYWVVTARPDGRPHVAPVWGVWLEETFYFATDVASRKGRNLAASPELIVHLESGDDVVILEGRAEEVREHSLLTRFADAYEAKYQIRPEIGEAVQGIYRLQPRAAYAWLERNFPTTATRWLFGAG